MRTAVFVQNRNFFGTQLIHLPLLHALRRDAGDAVTALVPYDGGGVFADSGAADEVRRYHRGVFDIARMLRRTGFDTIVTLRPQSAWLTAAIGLSRARVRAGFRSPLARALLTVTVPRDTRIYRGHCYMRLARALGCSDDLGAPFRRLAEAVEGPWDPGAAYCIMPAGGAGAFKCWPMDHYLRLAARLVEHDPAARLTWVLGPGEAHLQQRIADSEVGDRSHCLCAAPVGAIARAVLDARAVIANDCGPAHIAQMLEVPTAILFSDHDGAVGERVAEWFNPHPRARALTGPPGGEIGRIDPQRVADTVAEVEGK